MSDFLDVFVKCTFEHRNKDGSYYCVAVKFVRTDKSSRRAAFNSPEITNYANTFWLEENPYSTAKSCGYSLYAMIEMLGYLAIK